MLYLGVARIWKILCVLYTSCEGVESSGVRILAFDLGGLHRVAAIARQPLALSLSPSHSRMRSDVGSAVSPNYGTILSLRLRT